MIGTTVSHYKIFEELARDKEAKTSFIELWSEAAEGLPRLVDARRR